MLNIWEQLGNTLSTNLFPLSLSTAERLIQDFDTFLFYSSPLFYYVGSFNGLELHTFSPMQERKNEDKKKKKKGSIFLQLPLLDPHPLVANMHLWCFWLFYYYQCYPSYYMRDVLWELFFIQDDLFLFLIFWSI